MGARQQRPRAWVVALTSSQEQMTVMVGLGLQPRAWMSGTWTTRQPRELLA